jgi:hypothetical protein
MGTVFIAVFCHNYACEYRLNVESILTSYLTPTGFEGRLLDMNTDYFTLPITSQAHQIHIEVFGGPLQLKVGIGNTIYLATPSYYLGRSYLDISLMDRWGNPPENSTLFISLDISPRVGKLVGYYTTNYYYRYVEFSSLTTLDGLLRITPAISFFSPPCNLTATWSGLSDSPFNPPYFFFQSQLFDSSDSIWVYDLSIKNSTLYTYLQFDTAEVDSLLTNDGILCFSIDGTIVTEEGAVFETGAICPNALSTKCDSDAFTLQNEYLQDILNEIFQSYEDTAYHLVQMDIFRSNTNWLACSSQVIWYFARGSSQFNISSTNYLPMLNEDRVQSSCNNPNCTKLFLEDYRRNSNYFLNGTCTSNFESSFNVDWYKRCKEIVFGTNKLKRGRICVSDNDCKLNNSCVDGKCQSLGQSCNNDNDCKVEGATPVCDYWSGLCTDSQDSLERIFLNCYISEMPPSVQGALAEYENLTIVDKNSFEYFVELQQVFRTIKDQCNAKSGTGLDGLPYRDHYSYEKIYLNFGDHCACFTEINLFYDNCLDELCNLPDQCRFSAYDGVGSFQTLRTDSEEDCGYQIYFVRGSSKRCLEDKQCNWNPEGSLSIIECLKHFEFSFDNISNANSIAPNENETSTQFFCGVRLDKSVLYYRELINVTKEQCDEAKVCVAPQKSMMVLWSNTNMASNNTDQNEFGGYCKNEVGLCTGLCKQTEAKCVGKEIWTQSVCWNKVKNETECKQLSGEWMGNKIGVCNFWLQNTRTECERNGNKYVECGDFTVEECNTIVNDTETTGGLLECVMDWWAPCEQQRCEESGWCADNEYWDVEGACVIPFNEVDGHRFCFAKTTLTQIG